MVNTIIKRKLALEERKRALFRNQSAEAKFQSMNNMQEIEAQMRMWIYEPHGYFRKQENFPKSAHFGGIRECLGVGSRSNKKLSFIGKKTDN